MLKNQTSKWIADAALSAAFLAAFFLDQTGLELHQWIGTAAAGLAAYHLAAHWPWVCSVTRRFFGKTTARARLYYLVDALILGGFLAAGFTGLMISTWLNLELTGYSLWLHIHIQASILALVLTAVKLGLHWRWVAATTRTIFARPGRAAQPAAAGLRPAPAAVRATSGRQISRGDFLKLVGLVGAASALALRGAVSGLQDAGAVQAGASQAAAGQPAGISGVLETTLTGGSCAVACERRCSYPGHCPRYIDTNANRRCDHGECA